MYFCLINLPLSHSEADKFQLQKENGICWLNQPNEACCRMNKDNRFLSPFPSATYIMELFGVFIDTQCTFISCNKKKEKTIN